MVLLRYNLYTRKSTLKCIYSSVFLDYDRTVQLPPPSKCTTFSSPSEDTLCPWAIAPPSIQPLHPQTLATTSLLYIYRFAYDFLVNGIVWYVAPRCCLVTKLCLTLCDPTELNPPGSSAHGISQARILERAAMPSSRGSSWPRDWICISFVSCISRFFTTSAIWEPVAD